MIVSDDGGEGDEHDQPLVNLKDKMRELTETHDSWSVYILIASRMCVCV